MVIGNEAEIKKSPDTLISISPLATLSESKLYKPLTSVKVVTHPAIFFQPGEVYTTSEGSLPKNPISGKPENDKEREIYAPLTHVHIIFFSMKYTSAVVICYKVGTVEEYCSVDRKNKNVTN